MVGPSIGNVNACQGVPTRQGKVWLGCVEGFGEESLGQSAALGNFSEPDQSWTHFGMVPVAAASSAYDILLPGTLNQKASMAMYRVPDIANG